MCRFSIKFVELTRTVNSCVQVLTGAQRRVKTEAVATCVCLHLRSINTPLNTPVCVRRDRSWQLTAYAADLVSQNTTVVKQIYTFYFWNFIEPKAEKWTQDINWQWHISIIIWMPYFQPILEHQQHPPHLKYICNLLCTIICEAGSCHLICVQAWLANCFCDCDGPRACGDVTQNGILHDCRGRSIVLILIHFCIVSCWFCCIGMKICCVIASHTNYSSCITKWRDWIYRLDLIYKYSWQSNSIFTETGTSIFRID